MSKHKIVVLVRLERNLEGVGHFVTRILNIHSETSVSFICRR